ncbi:MAG: peptidoglycan DD-metalloendopeptidase family protein [Lachnospira sp.]
MKTVKHNNENKLKIVSAVITFGIIASLGFGVYSVIDNLNDTGKSNIVDLNETEGNVALKVTDADERANAGATMATKENKPQEKTTEEETETEKATQEVVATEAEDLLPLVPESKDAKSAVSDSIANYSFGEDSTLVWPVYGDITLEYNMDNTIYFKTLGLYKCSPAMIISAEKGSNVAVSASGVVTKVMENEETGVTVTVAVGDGYEVTYGLLNDVTVREGNTVTAEQLLGTVAEPTAYYKEEGPGVYFSVTHDGVPVDPADFLKE